MQNLTHDNLHFTVVTIAKADSCTPIGKVNA